MTTRTVQDDSREAQIAAHCRLIRNGKARGNKQLPDAFDRAGHPFELKSASKGSVTTARDVGLHTLRGWKERYWIIAFGENLLAGFRMAELYVAHPQDLAEFFGQLEERLSRRNVLCEEVLAKAARAGASVEAIRAVRLIMTRGITENNPHIPGRVVRDNATALSTSDSAAAAAGIRRFVTRYPL